MQIAPNRVAVYLTAGAALAGGLAPAVADLDVTSTGGIIAGLAVILGVVNRWLTGWQTHEANAHWADHNRFMNELQVKEDEA